MPHTPTFQVIEDEVRSGLRNIPFLYRLEFRRDDEISMIDRYRSLVAANAALRLAQDVLKHDPNLDNAAGIKAKMATIPERAHIAILQTIYADLGHTNEDAATLAFCDVQGYMHMKITDESGVIAVANLTSTSAVLTGLSATGYYEDRWCYASYDKAKAAIDSWDGTGEPNGWIRHPLSRRTRGG